MSSSFVSSHPLAASGVRPDDAVSLTQIGAALRRNRRWIILPALIAFLGSLVFVNTVSPRYTGEARIILESRDSYFTRPNQDRSDQPQQIDEQAVASQVQVVMSRDLAREAIKRLGLVGNEEFDPLVGGVGLAQRLLMMVGLGRNPLDRAPEDRILENYYERLGVFPVGKSRIIAVEFRAKDPELAAKAANTIVELYLEFQEGAKKDNARSASTWLGGNIETLRTRVAQAEAKVETFRARSGLLMGTNSSSINTQQLSDLNTQLAQARSARADAEAKARLIRDMIKGGRAVEIPDVANNELIRRLTEQRINLRAQLALELRTLLPEHPRIKELNAQLTDLDNQIKGAAERTVRTLENDAKIAGSRVETLQSALDTQKTVVSRANENEVELRALEREARAQRDQLEAYLARYREATARDAENAVPPDARIVSRAIVPEKPSFPKKVPTISLVTLAAIVLSAGGIVARELLSTPVGAAEAAGRQPAPTSARAEPVLARRDESDEDEASVAADDRDEAQAAFAFDEAEPTPVSEPVNAADAALAPLDQSEIEEEAPVTAAEPAPAPPAAEAAFDGLKRRLTRQPVGERGRRILVTAPAQPAEAASAARGIGRGLADSAQTILLSIDAGPDDVAGLPGFSDLVCGEASFLSVIGRETASRLHLVAPGRQGAAALAKEWAAVDIALEALDQTYGWIVGVLHDPTDAALLALVAPRVDAVVIVSDRPADDEALIALYDAAKEAGAADVVVARSGVAEEARRAA
ncbi:MAG TPA: GumC family protein [Beijerinckiaceae bacterium]|jgi:uncharacterized protein involved in exopolysaccharide biosynthesis